MPRNPQKEDPDSRPEGRRTDLPWRVVEGIEPEDDVLSKLTAEDEPGRPAAAIKAGASERRAAFDRPIMLERPAALGLPVSPGQLADPGAQAPLIRPAAPEPASALDRREAVAAPAAIDRATQPTHPAASRTRRWPRVALASVLLVAAAVVAWSLAGSRWPRSVFGSRANGTLVVDSHPAGALVTVDGEPRGQTPVTVSLAPGRHTFVLTGTATREMTVTIDPGSRVFQYIEMPVAPPAGTLRVETNLPGAQVSIDGVARGASPLEVSDLAPGPHIVSLRHGSTTVTQSVTVKAGDAVSLVVPLSQAEAASPGWVAVTSPIELQLYEGERLVGTSRADRVLMLPGRHDLRLVNLPLGFETSRVIQISPNRVTTAAVQPPNGVLHVNAVPWAEVFMDGNKIGDTPIANYSAALGSHEIVLRHPRFPERRMVVTVTLTTPARVGVDLQK